MHGLRHAVHSVFKGAVEAVTPVASQSQFESKRVRLWWRYGSAWLAAAWPIARLPSPPSLWHACVRAGSLGRVQLLTPDEFVKAGDFLIGMCGSWSWCVPRLRAREAACAR